MAGAQADTMEERGFLACSLWLVQLLFYTAQAHLNRNDNVHSGLGFPTDMATNLVEAISQLRFLLPRCIKSSTDSSNSRDTLLCCFLKSIWSQ